MLIYPLGSFRENSKKFPSNTSPSRSSTAMTNDCPCNEISRLQAVLFCIGGRQGHPRKINLTETQIPLPVISTGANSVLERVESASVSQHNLQFINLRNQFHYSVTIFANSQVLHNSYDATLGQSCHPKSYSQLLTVCNDCTFLFLLFNIMQNIDNFWNITSFNSKLQHYFPQILISLFGHVIFFCTCYKSIHDLIHFNHTPTRSFSQLELSHGSPHCGNILPLPSNGINVGQ